VKTMQHRFLVPVVFLAFFPVFAQQQRTIILDPQQRIYYADANDRSIRALPVRDNIYMIVGAGANITVQTGDEGVLVVDSGSGAATNEKVLGLIRQLSTKPIHYIINTSVVSHI
jgi:cyclase